MKVAMIIVRTLMGLLFVFASITYFLNLVPQPQLTGATKAFNEGLQAVGYFMPLLKVTELVCGLALVAGRFVPLATVILAPVIINILMFHAFIDVTGLPVAVFLVLANVFIAYCYRASYAGLLASKPAQPLA